MHVTIKRLFIALIIYSLLLPLLSFAAKETAAPDFSLRGEDGKIYSLKDFQGTRFVLFFFTFTCPHCIMALPQIEELHKQGISVLGVAFRTPLAELSGKAHKARISFPVAMGNKEIKESYDIKGVPTFILISSDGIIKERMMGERGALRLKQILLLNNKPSKSNIKGGSAGARSD